jgi:hypothetical protein
MHGTIFAPSYAGFQYNCQNAIRPYRVRWKVTRSFPGHSRIIAALGLGLLLTWLAWAPAAALATHGQDDLLVTTQLQTIAVCGQGTCNCGAGGLISRQNAPCQATSSTGECRSSSSGQCCVCEAPRTVAMCAESLCNCTNSVLLTQVSAPCTVTSSAGPCRVGSGQCCVCALD